MKTKMILAIACIACVAVSCKKKAQDILEATKPATVTIRTFDEYGSPAGSGSGFFIAADGTGITNYHVLDGSIKATIKTVDGKEYEIDSVLASSRKKDIIKFSIKNTTGEKFPYLTFAKDAPQQGETVYNVSAPLGLDYTFSSGMVSALRDDSHGEVVQISAPISQGSSGSAILNADGEVIAVATYIYKNGQNLNFGVRLNEEMLSAITENDFDRKNRKFNQKDNYVIVNMAATNEPSVRLNAIEFKKDATIAYFSYTNLDLSDAGSTIYAELNKKEKGFFIHDKTTDKKYFLVSSTLGDRNNQTEVPLASTVKFKVIFPGIRDFEDLTEIDIKEGEKGRGWRFEEINIKDYREKLNYDMDSYQKNYAYATMHEGDLDYATYLFATILEEDPEDVDALNAMAIIALVKEDEKQALAYLDEAIEYHPTSAVSYKNRAQYYKSKKDLDKALADVNNVVGIEGENPDSYLMRTYIYLQQEKYKEAKADLDMVLSFDEYKETAVVYYLRAVCACELKQWKSANEDLRQAYKFVEDRDLEKEISRLYNAIP